MIETDLLVSILEGRPKGDERLEQFLLDHESSVRQAEYLNSHVARGGVLFLGDDDHISLLFALMRDDVDVVVVEVDPRVVSSLRRWVRELNLLRVTIVESDLRSELSLASTPSLFYANPPWSSKNAGHGLRYWVSRGIDLTTDMCVGVVAMPGNQHVDWINENWLSMQRFLSANGCRILEVTSERATYQKLNDPRLFSVNLRFQRVATSTRAREPQIAGEGLYR